VRVLLVTHYFPPETGAPQARLSSLAAIWAADGLLDPSLIRSTRNA